MPQAGRKQNDGRHILHKSKTIKMAVTTVDRAYFMKKKTQERTVYKLLKW